MADVWGVSWGASSAWGVSWRQAEEPPEPPEPPRNPGGGITGKTFTRERWRKIREAEEALLAAEQKAIEIKTEARRLRFLAATQKAEEAIAHAYSVDASLAKLTAALEAAAAADRAADVTMRLRQIQAAANLIIKAAEDEEEADIELLLLN